MFAALGAITSPLFKLGDALDLYIKNKKTNAQLFIALSDEINVFKKIIDDLNDETSNALIPTLDKIEGTPTIQEIRNVASYCNHAIISYTRLWALFSKLVYECSGISKNPAFMSNLKESSPMLFDFVIDMANLKDASGKIKINNGFCSFFKLYQNELFKEYNNEKEVNANLRHYLSIIKTKITPLMNKQRIGRALWRSIISNTTIFCKTMKKITIESEVMVTLRAYVPNKLIGLVTLIDDSQLLNPLSEEKRKFDHK